MSQLILPFLQYAQCTHSSMEEVWHLVNNNLIEIHVKPEGSVNKTENGYFCVSGNSNIAITYIKYGQQLSFECSLDNAIYLQFYCAGSGEASVNSHLGYTQYRTNIFLPQQHIHVRLHDSAEQIVLRVDAQILESLLQSQPDLNRLRCSTSFLNGAHRACEELAMDMQQCLSLDDSERILDNFYQQFIDLCICCLTTSLCDVERCSKFTCSKMTTTSAGLSAEVAEIIHYLKENADQPYSLNQLMTVSDMSARGIYYQLQKELNTTPYKLYKSICLQKVREAILSAEGAKKTITDHAIDWGFTHVSRFSSIYRGAFGELPSKTLKSRKQLIKVRSVKINK